MPKKLTGLGVLLAVVLGAMGIWRDSAPADAAVQVYNPDITICYGGSYPTSLACNGGSENAISGTPGDPITTYTIISLPEGSRLTLPVVFTPSAFGFDPNGSANGGLTNCYDDDDLVDPVGAGEDITCVVGDVTSRTDLFCDDLADILSAGDSPKGAWPSTTNHFPFDFGHIYDVDGGTDGGFGVGTGLAKLQADTRNSYVLDISPAPSSYTFLSLDKAPLHNLWLGGNTGNALNPPTPLQTLTQVPPGGAFRVSSSLLAGNPENPPDHQFLCLDSPQDSVSTNQQLLKPATGTYPRWTLLQSAGDITDGTVDRVLDWECVNMNAAPAGDGDCVADASEPPACVGSIDCDSDGVPDGIEFIVGSNMQTDGDDADPQDGDDANDYEELFQGTDSNDDDTDGDGSEDKQDNGSDENGATAGFVDSAADDNCPGDNAAQTNSDSTDDLTGTPPPDGLKDITNPNEDTQGDVCDADDDNDGITDKSENSPGGNTGLHLKTVAPPAGISWCTNSAGPGSPAPAVLDQTDPDFDDDLGLDGRECVFSAIPNNPGAAPGRMLIDSGADSDNLNDFGETFYRTMNVSQPGGTPIQDLDGDAVSAAGATCADLGDVSGRCDVDSDNDGMQDGLEVKFYATDPADPDSDNDGCSDGREAASINNDRTVNATDLGQTAQRFGPYSFPSGAVNSLVKANYDMDKNRTIGASDLSFIAQRFGACATSFELGLEISNSITQN